ncbi:MAG: 1-acyl-sn-glycerol-3-phosphate acyltransferase [Myxococcota bacterium]
MELKAEIGPVGRALAARYFEPVRFPAEASAQLAQLHSQGFVVHVMRTTSWVNYLYLTWALLRRGLPPVRAVVNLRRWFTRPWRRTAQRGDFEVRFTYARRHGGSGLVFLKTSAFGTARGRVSKEDPFPALVALARRGEGNVFLVPELFVWEKWSQRLKPSLIDYVFGSPEAPGFLHSMLAFLRNYHRAQFRVGEPIDLRKFIEENAQDSDEVIARKVRGALHHHLARETRAVFGPPFKPPARVLEETLRDRSLRKSLEEIATDTHRRSDAVQREAQKCLESIAARLHPSVVALAAPLLHWVFHRIYDGIEVDEAGLERAMKAAVKAPIVLVPSHKSHIDYLVMSFVFWNRGYQVPLVAAGANLSFWPLGPFLRRGGAFFLRRSFKGDKVYTAVFKAYVKKLVHDGVHQEFFPEGGRSRTGKLLAPKLGLITWEVEAVLEQAAKDLYFVPVAIDYEKVVESSSYSRELAGGEKKPEDLKALLKTPKVLASRYGRIYLSFDEPISLVEVMSSRKLSVEAGVGEEQKKGLVRALAHRIMYGINRVSTVTPHALLSAALLAHRRRGITAREVSDRIVFLRQVCETEHAPLSPVLKDAPSDPTLLGPVQDAMRSFCSDGVVRTSHAKGEVIYQTEDARRAELSFYKNTLMNLLAGRGLVACALLCAPSPAPVLETKARALFLSRLFKFEFIYKVGETFDALFAETVEKLAGAGLLQPAEGALALSPDLFARERLELLADLLRDYLESYLVAALSVADVGVGGIDRRDFLKNALESARALFLEGKIGAAEALSRTNLENALLYLLDQGFLAEKEKKLVRGPSDAGKLAAQIHSFLERAPGPPGVTWPTAP